MEQGWSKAGASWNKAGQAWTNVATSWNKAGTKFEQAGIRLEQIGTRLEQVATRLEQAGTSLGDSSCLGPLAARTRYFCQVQIPLTRMMNVTRTIANASDRDRINYTSEAPTRSFCLFWLALLCFLLFNLSLAQGGQKKVNNSSTK